MDTPLLAPNKWAENMCNRPLAAYGLISYRYKGTFGWIMIGAKDHADALREAGRSTHAPIVANRLQVWNGAEYVNVE